jgi:hypothetical protein
MVGHLGMRMKDGDTREGKGEVKAEREGRRGRKLRMGRQKRKVRRKGMKGST